MTEMSDTLELWILNEAGICLFNYNPCVETDLTLFSGFLSAINAFGETITQQRIQNIDFISETFVFHHDPSTRLLFIARAPRTISEKQIREKLESTAKEFIIKYSRDDLRGWIGSDSYFADFTPNLEIILEDLSEKEIEEVKNSSTSF
jgi:hypothetical protein